MPENHSIQTFNATLDSLEPIRLFVTKVCEQVNLDKKKTYGLCLAIDEIATNIIKHGYEENGIENGIIDVTTIITENELEVTLVDTAVPFNPLEHELPDEQALNKSLEDRPIGGLGVMMACKSVHSFTYELKDKKNVNKFKVLIND